jgi:hypothetical protein
MKINWGRVVNAGLVAEILLLGVDSIFNSLRGKLDLITYVFVVIGSFVFMLVGALWVARKIESRFILHGFLVGVVAIVYYVIQSLDEVLSGQYSNYLQWFIIGHSPKLLGGIVGGYIAGKLKKRAL